MAEGVDTSSYPKPAAPPAQKSLLDQVGQYQQLDSQKQTIDKQKLDLVNQRFGEMAKGFTALANDPELNQDKINGYVQNQVKLGYVPADMAAKTISMVPPTQGLPPDQAKAKLKGFLEQQLTHAQSVSDAINFHYGQPNVMNVGNAQQPIRTSPKFGVQSTGLPIATQLPPSTSQVDENGQPVTRGVQPPQQAPGMATAPPPAPGLRGAVEQPPTPVAAPQTTGPTGPTVARPDLENSTFAQRFDPKTNQVNSAAAPLFGEGKTSYTEDQNLAAARATALKPAEQALKLLPGLRTGPGTEPFNKAVAFLKANNIIPTDTKDDPTAIYQEVSKKLAQYVGGSPLSNRSDAGQALAEASSPSPKTQIPQALEKLTRDAIALDRVQIARPNAFEGKNYQDYGKHRATFPQSIDERAFGLNDLPEAEKSKLVKTMYNRYKSNPKDAQALKFFKSLDIAKKQGFYDEQSQ